MPKARRRLVYLTDIDGLRALAVLAVVLFHLQIPAFTGGFVGVDIFFVVWAKFSAKTAWRRRALRAVRVGENSHPRLGTNETKLIAQ